MSDSLEPISITDVEGFSFGHWTNREAATGCTVIVAPHGAAAGVDVRGGAPASRETDLLRPENTVEQVHAVCLSGGSAFGLEAASGVARELESRGIGLDVGPTRVPIVCSSCLFDLAFGDAFVRPDVEAGAAATRLALDGNATGLAEGTVGAGTGATVGKLLGMDRAMKGGLGARAFSLGALKVGAISAVNACGNVVDPVTLEPVAGARVSAEGTRIVDLEEGMLDAGAGLTMPLDRTNTTISCIVTNARLTKAQATKVAQMAADAYAHVIRPTHTTNDGDTIYVLASGGADAPACPLDLLGLVATRALEAALVAGCREAEGICGLPAARDL
ncbi:P1 family peptidase [Collinsella tanakaei]|nr:P1 family peptidase [Collinsella tanakaei]MBM6777292.1 P1 family peptidase [Collinsella tanakaei]MBM6905499.1 P1 family peptidase [Collinsella tanakaei]